MLKAITKTEEQMKYKHAEKRAQVAKMCEKKVQSPTNKEGDPTTNRSRRMTKLAARLRELHNQLNTNDKYIAEGRTVSDMAEKQRQQLWTNISKEAVEELPYVQWLKEGKWKGTEMPPTNTVEKMAQVAKRRVEETEKENDQARRKIAKERMQEDMRSGGATAHKAVKSAVGAKKEFVQPTHTIKMEQGINSEPSQVHKAFNEEWAKKVFKLQRRKPEWEKSKKYMPITSPRCRIRTVRSTGRTCTKQYRKWERQCRGWMDGGSTSSKP